MRGCGAGDEEGRGHGGGGSWFKPNPLTRGGSGGSWRGWEGGGDEANEDAGRPASFFELTERRSGSTRTAAANPTNTHPHTHTK